ncbi:MAG TPA: carboxypeptidase-like regulatory domain-containing protein [Anaerolineae bacterium]|nr:carboxypeptidase-like regulatory domain-containing protein [Anaerolineae bacterium]
MTAHIPFATLIDYQDHAVSVSERETVESHLAEPCSLCQQNLQRAGELLAAFAQPDRTVAPPQDVVRRAMDAFALRPPAVSLTRIVASLLFDNFRQAPLAAVRGAARSRQLLFNAAEIDIDLQITAERYGTTLIGQVLSGQPLASEVMPIVRLYRNGEVIRTVASDAQGQFAFRAVTPGTYDLGVMLAHREVVLEGLELAHD